MSPITLRHFSMTLLALCLMLAWAQCPYSLQSRVWDDSKRTIDEQRTREFFWMFYWGFSCATLSLSFRLLADTAQSLLFQFDLPATCRGHSEAGLIWGRCTGPGSNHLRRTARMSWDSLAASAGPQFSTPSVRNMLVSSSVVNVKTEQPLCQKTTDVQVFIWQDNPQLD